MGYGERSAGWAFASAYACQTCAAGSAGFDPLLFLGWKITDYLYHALQARSGSTSQVMIMPAVGTHCLMTREQQVRFSGKIYRQMHFSVMIGGMD